MSEKTVRSLVGTVTSTEMDSALQVLLGVFFGASPAFDFTSV